MENKNVFREIIDDYEIARPGYTPELYNDIIEYSMIKNDAKILGIYEAASVHSVSFSTQRLYYIMC